jgi:uncharacterized protein
MFFSRTLAKKFERYVKFPVIVVQGPRQSGKTTLVRHYFKNYKYINLEKPEDRDFAINDPEGFLAKYENKNGIIIDEFQYAPQLLSYIQVDVDEKKRSGYFILTGSQNFLMNQNITQSLAGRVGILTLLPFSNKELITNKINSQDYNKAIINGCYPRLYEKEMLPEELYPSYIQTYVERDARQVISIDSLKTFQKFIALCAGRIGQLLNISEISMNCGIDRKTADKWISILEASYILFMLQPYFKNYNKRITKTAKIYFYDTGLACSLLKIRTADDLALSPFRGHLFENFIIADFYKQYYNRAINPPLYFWRDQNGIIEIDCIVDKGSKQIPIEIKSGATIAPTFFRSLGLWSQIADKDPKNGYIIYGGESVQLRKSGHVLGWKEATDLMEKIEKS